MKKLCVSVLFINLLLFGCNDKNAMLRYKVKRITNPVLGAANWDKGSWKEIEPLSVSNYMGEKPEHFPKTQVKVAYDDEAIYVFFRVEDRYVRAVRTRNQDPVYKDSAVEFFFSPEGDQGYFNLEMNCGGTMLFHHQIKSGKSVVKIEDADIAEVEVVHSLPKTVEPEMKEPVTWTVAYRIPFSVLKKYADFKEPEPGTVWRANFYKIGDETSHPHWLTWSPVNFPKPNFHMPEYFGELIFQ